METLDLIVTIIMVIVLTICLHLFSKGKVSINTEKSLNDYVIVTFFYAAALAANVGKILEHFLQ